MLGVLQVDQRQESLERIDEAIEGLVNGSVFFVGNLDENACGLPPGKKEEADENEKGDPQAGAQRPITITNCCPEYPSPRPRPPAKIPNFRREFSIATRTLRAPESSPASRSTLASCRYGCGQKPSPCRPSHSSLLFASTGSARFVCKRSRRDEAAIKGQLFLRRRLARPSYVGIPRRQSCYGQSDCASGPLGFVK